MTKIIPLAHRIRPQSIDDVVGQQHLLGEGMPLYKMIKNKHINSMILFGPPGIGKTTIAGAIANTLEIPFRALNGVNDGKKEIQKVIEEAKKEEKTYCLYIDEIHFLTKSQSEPLLPALEDGTIILIGSTTQSVYHSLPPGIISRTALYELKPLETNDIAKGLKRALLNEEYGLGEYKVEMSDDVIYHLAGSTGGDMRSALNSLEALVTANATKDTEEVVEITMKMVEEVTHKKNFSYNGEDTRYDLMSAFQNYIYI